MKRIVNIILIIFILFLMIPNISLAVTYKKNTRLHVAWAVQVTISFSRATGQYGWDKYNLEYSGAPSYKAGGNLNEKYNMALDVDGVNRTLLSLGYDEAEGLYQHDDKPVVMFIGRKATIDMYEEDGKYVANIKTEDGAYSETIKEKSQEKLQNAIGDRLWKQGADNNIKYKDKNGEEHTGYEVTWEEPMSDLSEVSLVKIRDFDANDNIRYGSTNGCVVYMYASDQTMRQVVYSREDNKKRDLLGQKIVVISEYRDENSGEQWCSIQGAGNQYVKSKDLTQTQPSQEEIDSGKKKKEEEEAAREEAINKKPPSSGMLTRDAAFGPSGVLVATAGGTDITDPTKDAGAYKPDDLSDTNEILTKAGVIIGILRNIGIVVGVIGLSAIGLRYMFASITEKAEYKETMMPYLLGCILLMAGTIMIDFIYQVAVSFGK